MSTLIEDKVGDIFKKHYEFFTIAFSYVPSITSLLLLTLSIFILTKLRFVLIHVIVVLYTALYSLFGCRKSQSSLFDSVDEEYLHKNRFIATCYACGYKQWVNTTLPQLLLRIAQNPELFQHDLSRVQAALWAQTPYGWENIPPSSLTMPFFMNQYQGTTLFLTSKASPVTLKDMAVLWDITSIPPLSQNDLPHQPCENLHGNPFRPQLLEKIDRQSTQVINSLLQQFQKHQTPQSQQRVIPDLSWSRDPQDISFVCCHAECGVANGQIAQCVVDYHSSDAQIVTSLIPCLDDQPAFSPKITYSVHIQPPIKLRSHRSHYRHSSKNHIFQKSKPPLYRPLPLNTTQLLLVRQPLPSHQSFVPIVLKPKE